MIKTLIITAVVVLLAACAAPKTKSPSVASVRAEIEARKQRELALEARMEAEKRLHRIGYPILQKGAVLCGEKVRPSIGALAWNATHFDKEWRAAAERRYGISKLLQFVYVMPGSPAEQAGLRTGDVPVTIGDWSVPVGSDAAEEYAAHLLEALRKDHSATLEVLRGDKRLQLNVTPVEVCDYQLVLEDKDEKNAYADGERIVVYQGLMDFFRSDEEAALVLSHELAHNTMEHIAAQQQNAALGGMAGLLLDLAAAAAGVNTGGNFTDLGMKAGMATYSVEFEQEADYVGLYFMALAGYRIDDAANFWRRMAIQNAKSIRIKTSHPTTPERFVAIEQAVEEIRHKQQAGLPLQPEYKGDGGVK